MAALIALGASFVASLCSAQGTFRGTLAVKWNAADQKTVKPDSVQGTATWRFERDSLDWRRKLTLHIDLANGRGSYIIRTADTVPPRRALTTKNVPSSHLDARFFTASLVVRENGPAREYASGDVVADSVIFFAADSLSPTTRLRGTVGLHRFRAVDREVAGARPGQQAVRILTGRFEAAFDPRPDPTPRTMTADLQTKILQQALYDFAITWMSYRVNERAGDSTTDNDKARAFLIRRWSEAAIVDSVAVDKTHLRVRLRGRYVPIICRVDERIAGSACTRPSSSH